MANWRVLAETFLDGLSPLDALIQRPTRPGAGENLIDVDYWPPTVWDFSKGEIPSPHNSDQREAGEPHGF